MRAQLAYLAAAHVLSPAVRTSVSATAVDRQGFESLTFNLAIGTCTNGGFAFGLQDSDQPSSNFVAVDSSLIEGTIPNVAVDQSPDAYSYANTSNLFGYKGNKRYVKLVATVTGAPGTGIACSCTAIKGRPSQGPATAVANN